MVLSPKPNMKFLHTADWQIGMKAVHVGSSGDQVRKARLEAVQKVIEIANRNKVEFMVLAGDTFQDNAVDRILVQKVADLLGTFRSPVFIIPGNHDPFHSGSVWDHPAWRSSNNIKVMLEEKPVDVPGGLLYPCPAFAKYSGKNPTAWIRATLSTKTADSRIHIGVAHGAVENVPLDEPDYPIPENAALLCGLDYLALGHWHSTLMFTSPDGALRMAYAGTHETTKFGERDSGNALIVEIPEPGAHPNIFAVRTGFLDWLVIEEDILHPGDLLRLREKIEAIEKSSTTLLNLRVKGLLFNQDYQELQRINEIATARFLFYKPDFSGLNLAPNDTDWVLELPVGVLRKAGEKLRELSSPGYQGPRSEGMNTEVATRALMLLYSFYLETKQ